MLPPDLHARLVRAGVLLHVSCTGAGPSALSMLWRAPGASDYLVGCAMPYAVSELADFLGFEPEGPCCSREIAVDMAMASYLRAAERAQVTNATREPLGLSITAAVATRCLPRGAQRAHVCLVTRERVLDVMLPLERAVGARARHRHDLAVAAVALELLRRALPGDAAPPSQDGAGCAELALERFFARPLFAADGRRERGGGGPGVFLPATLNPLHDGHRALCAAYRDGPVTYLVTASPPHKPAPSVQELLERAAMVRGERWRGAARAVEFSGDEPLFIDKARRRPGSVFLIGVDALVAMLRPSWGVGVEPMLREMADLGTRFLVMGRLVDGRWLELRDVPVPSPYEVLFRPLDGRADVSSTALRARSSKTTYGPTH